MQETTLSKFDEYQVIKDEEIKTGKPILKVDKRGTARVPLRFLPPDAGDFKDIEIGSCGFFCEASQRDLFK